MDRKSIAHESILENYESLFSFEFVVESVSNLHVSCTAPAVGIRFLDYPTIMIYHTDQEKVKSLRLLASNETHKTCSDVQTVSKDEIPPNLRECDGSFCFKKGKSTLFSMMWQTLSNRLSSIPLYIVLIDAYDEMNTKLIGNCTLPLHSIIDDIREKIFDGMQAAVFSKRIINLNLFNLMGAKIGHLKGNVALYCYGNSLNRHFQSIKGVEADGMDVLLEKQIPSNSGANSDLVVKQEQYESRKSANIVKKLERINKSTETDNGICFDTYLFNYDEYKPRNDDFCKKDTKSQRNINAHNEDSWSRVRSQFVEYNVERGTCCPPPLFYCSDNVDPFPPQRVIQPSQLYSDNDGIYRKKEINPEVRETDFVISAERVDDEIQPNKAQVKFLMQSEKDSKCEGGSHSTEFERRTINSLSVNIAEKVGDLDTVLSSLDSMPLLQGLFREIIRFSKNEGENKLKVAKENSEATCFGAISVEGRKEEECSNALSGIEHYKQNKESRTMTQKDKYTSQKTPKKLHIKATKSHRLRCAINANKKSNRSPYYVQNPVIAVDKGMHGPKAKHSTKNTILQRKESSDPKKVNKQLSDSTSHAIVDDFCDISSNIVDQASMKSKSPVSLEIYMPSTAGSNVNSYSSEEFKTDNPILNCDSNEGHTGIHWPKPLEKKWSGLDDLSGLKESTNVLQSEDVSLEPVRSIGDENEPATTHRGSFRRPSYSGYSDNFHSVSISDSSLKEKELAPNTGPPDNYAVVSHRSSSDNSRQSEKFSRYKSEENFKHQGVSASNSPASPRPLSQRSLKSSHSSAKSHSIESTPRRNNSDASRPIVSAHSPTTSRSLRTKPRSTYQSNGEITRSIDMSSNESLRTDSKKEESLPEDDIKDSIELFVENQHYSDDFVSANSQGSSTMEEHRSPTPRHIILAQAKLGYTM